MVLLDRWIVDDSLLLLIRLLCSVCIEKEKIRILIHSFSMVVFHTQIYNLLL